MPIRLPNEFVKHCSDPAIYHSATGSRPSFKTACMLAPLRIPFKLRATPVRLQHRAISHPHTAIQPAQLRDGRWAVDPFPSPVQDVGIDHRRLHVLMPEQFLNRADIIAIFQQVRGERVSQRVAAHRLGQARPFWSLL